MVIVAVAGGTGAVGRSIVEALNAQAKHEVLVLSRTRDSAKEAQLGARLVATDYGSVKELVDILESNNVHTVVSALSMMPHTGGLLEPLLIQAANRSRVTKRMIPSEYGFPQREEDGSVMPSIPLKHASIRALEACDDLQWTVFYVGYFMDYFGMPILPSYLEPVVMLIDMAANTAAIPGHGDQLVTFTHTSDLGRFVAASIDLVKWETSSIVIGDKTTLTEAVKMAEEAKGTRFNIFYDGLSKLKRGEVTELPSQASMNSSIPREFIQAIGSKFGVWVSRGDLDLDEQASLNKSFPDIETIKLREFLFKAWKD